MIARRNVDFRLGLRAEEVDASTVARRVDI